MRNMTEWTVTRNVTRRSMAFTHSHPLSQRTLDRVRGGGGVQVERSTKGSVQRVSRQK
jgi:hypothetical protein